MSNNAKIKKVDQTRIVDSLINFNASMGAGKDKRSQSMFGDFGRMAWDEIESLYRSDWIAGKIIEIVPDDMTKNWRTFSDATLTPEERTSVVKEERRLKLKNKVNRCLRWARLYGGCLLVVDVADGKDPSEELKVEDIKEGELRNLLIFDRRHASPLKINTQDPFADNFREPQTYTLANTSKQIHHTRMVRFEGVALPYSIFQRNDYWGDPVYKRIRDALINANIAIDSSANLLFESNVDIVKVDGLMHMLASDEATKALVNRFQMGKLLKANNNITLMDRETEEIEKLVNSFSGIGDMMDKFLTILSASSDIPATRLFGTAPAGMNATGESDLLNYYDMITSKQDDALRPQLEFIDQLMAANLGITPDKMEFNFDPLWQLSDVERAQVKLSNAQADQINLDNGIVTESMIAQEAKNQGIYGTITDEWINELEGAALEAKKFEEEASKMALENSEVEENGNSINGIGESTEEPENEEEEESETDETEQD